jgi:hypothetical protein
MTQAEFLMFARGACLRAVETPGFIGFLRLTKQYRQAAGECKIREPELCQAFIDEAKARGLYFGLEVPTDCTYRFTPVPGEGKRRALHDFVVFGLQRDEESPRVRIELKEGSPSMRRDHAGVVVDVPALAKDLQKLLREPSLDGRAVVHVLQAADENGTLPSLLAKYRVALRTAMNDVRRYVPAAYEQIAASWFSILILAVRRRGAQHGNRPGLWRLQLRLATDDREPAQDLLGVEPEVVSLA